MKIQGQNFGVEIELTGITRPDAAKVIADYFGTERRHAGTSYDTYTATDRKGRTWKAMSDGSIEGYYKVNGQKVFGGRAYSCEIVTPILQYEDIEDLQNIVPHALPFGPIVKRVFTRFAFVNPPGLYQCANKLLGRFVCNHYPHSNIFI